MSWGGARRGAGRPAKGAIASEPHKTRAPLAARHPVLVIARMVRAPRRHDQAGSRSPSRSSSRSSSRSPSRSGSRPPSRSPSRSSSRSSSRSPSRSSSRSPSRSSSRSPSPFSRRAEYAALRRALALSLARADFRIIHLALHRGQLELIVEADDKLALARGMQGFQVCAAKRLNRSVRRRGTVFPDRYHVRILRTRRDVRGVIGGMSLAPTPARPETWLLQIELARAELLRADMARDQPRRSRRWIHTRADEDG